MNLYPLSNTTNPYFTNKQTGKRQYSFSNSKGNYKDYNTQDTEYLSDLSDISIFKKSSEKTARRNSKINAYRMNWYYYLLKNNRRIEELQPEMQKAIDESNVALSKLRNFLAQNPNESAENEKQRLEEDVNNAESKLNAQITAWNNALEGLQADINKLKEEKSKQESEKQESEERNDEENIKLRILQVNCISYKIKEQSELLQELKNKYTYEIRCIHIEKLQIAVKDAEEQKNKADSDFDKISAASTNNSDIQERERLEKEVNIKARALDEQLELLKNELDAIQQDVEHAKELRNIVEQEIAEEKNAHNLEILQARKNTLNDQITRLFKLWESTIDKFNYLSDSSNSLVDKTNFQ